MQLFLYAAFEFGLRAIPAEGHKKDFEKARTWILIHQSITIVIHSIALLVIDIAVTVVVNSISGLSDRTGFDDGTALKIPQATCRKAIRFRCAIYWFSASSTTVIGMVRTGYAVFPHSATTIIWLVVAVIIGLCRSPIPYTRDEHQYDGQGCG
jgi:hypothetical protein